MHERLDRRAGCGVVAPIVELVPGALKGNAVGEQPAGSQNAGALANLAPGLALGGCNAPACSAKAPIDARAPSATAAGVAHDALPVMCSGAPRFPASAAIRSAGRTWPITSASSTASIGAAGHSLGW